MSSVRRATPADVEDIAAIEVACFHDVYGRWLEPDVLARVTLESSVARWKPRLEASDLRAWVVEAAGAVVGHSLTRVWSDTDDLPAGTEKLNALYVTPGFHRRGLGSLLLNTVQVDMQTRDVEVAALWVIEQNARARKFYEHWGWRPGPPATKVWRGLPEVRYTRLLARTTEAS